jgi:type II secretory pathway pseudopilin PulG
MNVRNEKGQALILALGFLMFFGLVIGLLLSLASSSVRSSSQLREQRSTVYAADGATDAAIEAALKDKSVTNQLGAYGDPRCVGSNPTTVGSTIMLTTTATTIDGTVAKVVCTWSQDFFAPDRTITFTTFVSGNLAPVVQATVLYHDHSSPVTAEVQSWVYCGHNQQLTNLACPPT